MLLVEADVGRRRKAGTVRVTHAKEGSARIGVEGGCASFCPAGSSPACGGSLLWLLLTAASLFADSVAISPRGWLALGRKPPSCILVEASLPLQADSPGPAGGSAPRGGDLVPLGRPGESGQKLQSPPRYVSEQEGAV